MSAGRGLDVTTDASTPPRLPSPRRSSIRVLFARFHRPRHHDRRRDRCVAFARRQPQRIHAEHFTVETSAAAGAAAQPRVATTGMADVTVLMDGRRRTFKMRMGGETLLDAAASAGIDHHIRAVPAYARLPHAARAVSRDGSGLRARGLGLRRGFGLACQAHPTTASRARLTRGEAWPIDDRVGRRAGVARLTLNRPDRLNSFNVEMHEECGRQRVASPPSGRAFWCVWRGTGFCAGRDLSVARSRRVVRRGPGLDPAALQALVLRCGRYRCPSSPPLR